jgi:hypothetical protein
MNNDLLVPGFFSLYPFSMTTPHCKLYPIFPLVVLLSSQALPVPLDPPPPPSCTPLYHFYSSSMCPIMPPPCQAWMPRIYLWTRPLSSRLSCSALGASETENKTITHCGKVYGFRLKNKKL